MTKNYWLSADEDTGMQLQKLKLNLMVMLGVMNTPIQIILKVGTVIELIQVVKIMKMINGKKLF